MNVVVNQFAGLGDVVFSMTLVKRIANGNPIIWPVLKQFVEGLTRAYPDVKFVDFTKFPINYESKEHYVTNVPNYGECTILPIRWADAILKVPYTDCMKSKYMSYGMEWKEWKEQAMWTRSPVHEQALFEDLKLPESYNLINRFFRSDMSGCAKIDVHGMEMCNIAPYSLFDWVGVMERATEIHTVSTSIIYMLEMLDLKCPIHLYPRKPDEVDFRNVDYILQRHNYIKHL